MARSGSSDIDRFLGHRIKELRLLACVSQQEVARQLGVRAQQMQKFEKGINRVSAAQLFVIAQMLDVAVVDLFDGYSNGAPLDPPIDAETSRMLFEVTSSFLELGPKQQEALVGLIRALAAED